MPHQVDAFEPGSGCMCMRVCVMGGREHESACARARERAREQEPFFLDNETTDIEPGKRKDFHLFQGEFPPSNLPLAAVGTGELI